MHRFGNSRFDAAVSTRGTRGSRADHPSSEGIVFTSKMIVTDRTARRCRWAGGTAVAMALALTVSYGAYAQAPDNSRPALMPVSLPSDADPFRAAQGAVELNIAGGPSSTANRTAVNPLEDEPFAGPPVRSQKGKVGGDSLQRSATDESVCGLGAGTTGRPNCPNSRASPGSATSYSTAR